MLENLRRGCLILAVCSSAWADEIRELPIPENSQVTKVTDQSKPEDVFRQMSVNFQADKAMGIKATYQFVIGGPEGGHWWISVAEGSFKIGTGKLPKADVTLMASDRDWVRLSTGSLGGTRAFLTGRLKIHGDQGLARRLDQMFP